ncbi:cytochrome C peroxidase [Riemerella anatipestifer]|uniref:cytochrome-c peroxidase n=1 Tax=Riemerella anatipestifer TaxID=34085 RepID=UPI00129D8573|nr:cytochrome c peroxidase [Riemerella anatipestifer]MRM96729.1 cytochrome C peroxidase [Riemerella anatipestifer]MRN01518.1 cytochrome C peroxidase [Riemerella anatipestifer]MRN03596.1 cytochrome C peroxidase [Riemerella anatipestifer]QYR02639.1 cytochrome C peroxidase [Riemerella anatipestifer]
MNNKKNITALSIIIVLSIFSYFLIVNKFITASSEQNKTVQIEKIKTHILKQNEELKKIINHILDENNSFDKSSISDKFIELRNVYKTIEWATEYFAPYDVRFINGPALPDFEMEEQIILEPEGLQVIEELIFSDPTKKHFDEGSKKELIRMFRKLLNKSNALEIYFKSYAMNAAQIMDALKLQIYRIITLGITGFDTPLVETRLSEAKFSLQGIKNVLGCLFLQQDLNSVNLSIDKSISYLEQNVKSVDDFDYLTFIKDYLNRVSSNLYQLQVKHHIPHINVERMLNPNISSIFDENAFNPQSFIPHESFKSSPEKARLGELLFNDRILSRDQLRSCADCHNKNKAFTDGLVTPISLQGHKLQRNTMSINYSSFQHGQFWDMRVQDLEEQTKDVMEDRHEMNANIENVIKKLEKNASYFAKFKQIYNTNKIEDWQIYNAVSSYVRSLSKFNSKFDKHMRGNDSTMSENQKKGFNLFIGKGKCATCHFIPLFNGTIPPMYTKTEQEILGTPKHKNNLSLSPDLGRAKHFPLLRKELKHSFKTPTLRNISKTAPYMHNGVYDNLHQVLDFYNKGGGKGLGIDIDNQTLPENSLNLSNKEIDKIIDFLNALDDE